MNLVIKDTTFAGDILNEIQLSFSSENVTIEDIIRHRVEAEVEKYNQQKSDYFQGLVQPSKAEVLANVYKMKKHQEIDAEKQIYVALNAFQNNAFFVLVNDLQAEELDLEVQLTPTTEINFIKLTPLVGG